MIYHVWGAIGVNLEGMGGREWVIWLRYVFHIYHIVVLRQRNNFSTKMKNVKIERFWKGERWGAREWAIWLRFMFHIYHIVVLGQRNNSSTKMKNAKIE